jgi:hypothetical protein
MEDDAASPSERKQRAISHDWKFEIPAEETAPKDLQAFLLWPDSAASPIKFLVVGRQVCSVTRAEKFYGFADFYEPRDLIWVTQNPVSNAWKWEPALHDVAATVEFSSRGDVWFSSPCDPATYLAAREAEASLKRATGSRI